MANTITGRVLQIGPTQQLTTKTGKTFPRREMLLDMTRHDPFTGERDTFENIVCLEFTGDKGTALLDTIQVGQIVNVTFLVRGFSYNNKEGNLAYMTKIAPYNVEPVQRHTPSQTPTAPSWQQTPPPPATPTTPATQPEDLPF